MATKSDFSFDDLAALCPHVDIERFRSAFMTMFDMNGEVLSTTVGFNFSFDDEDHSCEAEFKELVDLFKPVAIWAGRQHVLDKVNALGYQGSLFHYFEDGGFMVILKIPVARPE